MTNDKPIVMIATPSHDGRVDINYAKGLSESIQVLSLAGVKTQTAFVCTSSVDNARSVLATLFMKSTCTHLLFIDDDMAWASDLPLRLLNEAVDIVGVPYRKKKGEPEYTAKYKQRIASLEDHHWMVMVEGLGMGMTLIRRNVFEKLKAHVPLYHCYATSLNDPQRLFFRHDLVRDPDDNELKYESEDFHFCRLARKHGFDIWAYADENISHIGRRAFSGAFSDHIKGDIPHGFTSERPRMPVNLVGIEK